ncbi:MAG: aldo/keto reductase, partial [Desulfurococcales archaeon]|nr:aldo/keto reductase [Desulfurococcales archaeon]
GPEVFPVGLGLWQHGSRLWGYRGSVEVLAEGLGRALEEGINLVDTAEVYGWGRSEKLLGEALRRLGARGEFVVVSKVGGFRHSRGDIVGGARGIAERLGYPPDILLHHWPPPLWARVCEVIRGLEDAVNEGFASYYGLSNYPEDLLEDALSCTKRVEPIAIQAQYSLAYRQPEKRLIPLARSAGMGFMAWSPLAKGALAGKRKAETSAQRGDPVFRVASRDERLQSALREAAERLEASMAEVALAWLVSKGVVAVVGWRRPERIPSIAKAGRLKLPEDVARTLDEASRKYVDYWGPSYKPPSQALLKITPGTIQKVLLTIAGGI